MNPRLAATVVTFSLIMLSSARAAVPGTNTIIINPSDDGEVYICDGCNPAPTTSVTVNVLGSIQGIVRFSIAQINGPIASAYFTVNPYSEPVQSRSMDVYGITTGGPNITYSDANAGDFLGMMDLTLNPGFGRDSTFDVTQFLRSAPGPYVGFDLRGNVGTFSSLEKNYGHPSQLVITLASTPEPATILLFPFAMAWCFARRRRPTSHHRN